MRWTRPCRRTRTPGVEHADALGRMIEGYQRCGSRIPPEWIVVLRPDGAGEFLVRPGWLEGAIAQEGDWFDPAAGVSKVLRRGVLGAAVVPHRHGVCAPAEADLVGGLARHADEPGEQRLPFVGIDVIDLLDEGGADEQRASSGDRVNAHDGVVLVGELGESSARALPERAVARTSCAACAWP